jgi:prophage regulatory protein
MSILMTSQFDQYGLQSAGFLRLKQIIGDPKSEPPIMPIIPISKSAWWAGVKTGRYPKPVSLGKRTTAWRVEDIVQLIQELNGGGQQS